MNDDFTIEENIEDEMNGFEEDKSGGIDLLILFVFFLIIIFGSVITFLIVKRIKK